MQLHIDETAHKKFQHLKAQSSNSNQSDSEFLTFLLDHVENCTVTFRRRQPRGSVINRCPECGYETKERGSLCEHFEIAHNEDGSFSCTCGHNFDQLATFLLHYIDCPVAATDLVDSHTDLPPRKRLRAKRSPNDAPTHQPSTDDSDDVDSEHCHSYHHFPVTPIAGPSADKPYGCPKCSKGFKSKSLLEQHMHLHYPPRYKCRWCGNLYRWPPVYYHHKQKCKKRPSHLAPDSSNRTVKSESSPFALNTNSGLISDEQLSQAQETLSQFMQFHMMTLPKPDLSSNGLAPTQSNNPPNETFTLNCLCSEVFKSVPDYLEHTKVCSKFLSASSSLFGTFTPGVEHKPPTSVQSASFSPPQIPDSSDLSSHTPQTTATPPINGVFPCSICGKDFTSKLSLKQHVDGKHRAEGKYLCPTCGKRYRWGASFYYHKKTCAASVVTAATSAATLVENKPSELVATST